MGFPSPDVKTQTLRLCQAAHDGDVQAVHQQLPHLRADLMQPSVAPLDLSAVLPGGVVAYQALVHAAEQGHLPVVELLLRNGAQLDWQGQNGYAALHMAVLGGHRPVVERLLQAGALAEPPCAIGYTPLMLAAVALNVPLVERLLQHGVDVNGRGTLRNSALHVLMDNPTSGFETAVTSDGRAMAMARLLIDAGADVQAINDQGLSALSMGTPRSVELDALLLRTVLPPVSTCPAVAPFTRIRL